MNWIAKIVDMTEHTASVSVHLMLESETGIQVSRMYEVGQSEELKAEKFIDLALTEFQKFASIKEASESLHPMIGIDLLKVAVDDGKVTVTDCAIPEKLDALAESGLVNNTEPVLKNYRKKSEPELELNKIPIMKKPGRLRRFWRWLKRS